MCVTHCLQLTTLPWDGSWPGSSHSGHSLSIAMHPLLPLASASEMLSTTQHSHGLSIGLILLFYMITSIGIVNLFDNVSVNSYHQTDRLLFINQAWWRGPRRQRFSFSVKGKTYTFLIIYNLKKKWSSQSLHFLLRKSGSCFWPREPQFLRKLESDEPNIPKVHCCWIHS